MRTATWENIGTDVSKHSSLDDVLKKSGLDFTVKKEEMYTKSGDNLIKLDGVVSTVIEGTDKVLGIVGENYQICQNRDAFEFINYIEEDIEFVKSGMTYSGMVYIIAKLPKVSILNDSFTPYAIFQNGFNGGISIKAAICPLRIVCQNQFNIAFKESNNQVSIRHNTTMEEKLSEARMVMRLNASYMSSVNAEAEKLAGIKLPESRMVSIVENMFKITPDMSVRQQNSAMMRREMIMLAYNSDDNSNFHGTAWGAVNAYSDYITHSKPARMTKNYEENHFMHVSFDNSMISNFIDTVVSVA